MAAKPKATETEISILEITQGEMSFAIVGQSPLYFNSMSFKSKQSLLLGTRKKTEADKASSLKHNPPQEFRDSVYRWFDEDHPTRLKLPAPAFKGTMGTAALVLPGTRKTEIGRLVWVTSDYVPLWGVPKLAMDIVRSADMARTPDVRTRAKVEHWAALVTVRFVKPNLTERAIANLLAAGGIVAGVGDFRQEKGKGNFGQFRLADLDDPEFLRIQASGGRVQQDDALRNIECYDDDSRELLEWYHEEVIKRGRDTEQKASAKEQKEADKAAKLAAREMRAATKRGNGSALNA